MKKIRMLQLSAVVIIFLLNGCLSDFNLNPTIYGDGHVVKKDRHVDPFNVLKVSSGIDVFITQGDQEALVVEADENLHNVILTEVSNGVLKIHTDYFIRKAESKKVHLTYKNLAAIHISSAGDVKGVNQMKAGDISISLSSAGDLNLSLDASRVEVNISSSGDVTLSGTTTVLDASLSSAGDLNASDLVAERCRARVSSAGDAWVNATKELDMESSSAGDIYYTGEAAIIHMSTSSGGKIIKK